MGPPNKMGKIDIPEQITSSPSKPTQNEEKVSKGLDYVEKVSIDLKSQPDVPDDGIELLPIKKVFGLDYADNTYMKELSYIRDWAKENHYDKDTLNEKLRAIKYKIGRDDDKSTIKAVYQYIRINESIQNLVHKERMLTT